MVGAVLVLIDYNNQGIFLKTKVDYGKALLQARATSGNCMCLGQAKLSPFYCIKKTL